MFHAKILVAARHVVLDALSLDSQWQQQQGRCRAETGTNQLN
jgi:hypothetical protein